MDQKIIQIIHAPSGMFAKWEPDTDNEEIDFSPIACLSLVGIEDEYGNSMGQSVHPMAVFEDGAIEDVFDFYNFGGIVFREKDK